MKEFYIFCKNFGVEFPMMLAGLFGGLAFISKPNELSKKQKALTVGVGIVTANYLTPLAIYILHLPANVGYGLAFLLGFTGLKSIELIIKKYEQYKNKEK